MKPESSVIVIIPVYAVYYRRIGHRRVVPAFGDDQYGLAQEIDVSVAVSSIDAGGDEDRVAVGRQVDPGLDRRSIPAAVGLDVPERC